MKLDLITGRRVLRNSLVLATTLATCTALQANEHHDDKKASGKAHKEHAGKGGPMTAEKFVQKARACGEMDVQLWQMGQQSQNQEVKNLATTMARDHKQANQKLQQLASSKNISAEQKGEIHAKHQECVDKLKSQSGAEFDKEFVRTALKHHKKEIAAFERAQNEINDPQVKSFISETLPVLRQHYQMAKTAARSVGVDEASIAAEIDADEASAAGAAAAGERGANEQSERLDRPRSSLDGATDVDASGTINQNDPSLKIEADADPNASVDTDADGDQIFQKGDGKVLGLPTAKDDGKFLGIIPNPRADNDADDEVEVEADVDADADDSAVGASATVETESSKKDQ